MVCWINARARYWLTVPVPSKICFSAFAACGDEMRSYRGSPVEYGKRIAVLLLTIIATACAPQEILLNKSAAVPADVNFTGQWRLRKESDESSQQLETALREAGRGDESRLTERPRKSSRSTKSKTALVNVFLENGTSLKVTQTAYALFVSFDRSVVEEYRFGENREVSVGPVDAQRVSGWESDTYVIETLDENGNKLVDRYLLEDEGQTLLRQVSIYVKGKLTLSVVQKFDRVT